MVCVGSTVVHSSRNATRAAGTAAVVGAIGGELAVLATVPAPVTVHLVAARSTPDVAVHPVGSTRTATSAGKEPHAAVAVLVEVEVKEPAVEVVAGCLEGCLEGCPEGCLD
jgi:hypothetical protein